MSIYLSPAQLQCIHIWRNEVHRSCPVPTARPTASIPPRSSAGSLTSTTTTATTAAGPPLPGTASLFHALTIALQPSPPLDMHALIEQPRRNSRWRRWLNLPPKPQHTNMYTNAAPPLNVSLHAPLDQFPDLAPPASDNAPPSLNAPSAPRSRIDSPAGADAGGSTDVDALGPDEKNPLPLPLPAHSDDDSDDTYSDSSAGRPVKGSRIIQEKQARLLSAQKLLLKTQRLALERLEADSNAKADLDLPPAAAAAAPDKTPLQVLPPLQTTPFIVL
ncbi:hypothetical protein BROUX41_000818 [Berkeleyomyces rouxiae]|uniref:uncharacterized protein n=1 Tax=Berkeleyomyces rouxiae TaxID=2035830 RepID=UPI003B768486